MTKRDSDSAGIDSPRGPMSLHRRQSTLPGQHSSAAASSDHNPRLAPTPGSWPPSQYLPHATEPGDVTTNANHYGYTADTLPVPLPSRAQSYPQGETSPLQTTGGKCHLILHTHIFKKVIAPHSETPDLLMVTEVDGHGEEHIKQPEYFFNGIIGHVRSTDGGYIDSWQQSNRLANYWRRYYGIPERQDNFSSWNSSWQPSDNADQTSEHHESPHESEMDDDTSAAANPVPLQVPSQIHQLASSLYNILSNDRAANAAILEKIETEQPDLSDPSQLFTAGDLAHLSSHLANTSQILSQHALQLEMDDLSEIEDGL